MFQEQKKLFGERIDQFQNRLKEYIYEDSIELSAEYAKVDSIQEYKGKFVPITKGTKWGKNWERAWFHIKGKIPVEWKGKNVVARLQLGGEGLVFDENGTPKQSISVHTIWPSHEFIRERVDITENAKGGKKINFTVEVSAGQLLGLTLSGDKANMVAETYGNYEATIDELSLAVFRKDIQDLFYDVFVLNNQMKSLDKKSVRRNRILYTFQKAMNCFDHSPVGIAKIKNILKTELDKTASDSDLTAAAVGHAHLDTAWLWPLNETLRKCARTFVNQIENIEKYPNYIFGASQPQHYQFVKDNYPKLYKKIKEKVKEGRWEVQGGMWVEADCNLPGGESLVRQILHGKNFFLDEFGIDVKNLWIPDVFGYSATMPQIIKKSGMDYFITQKLSWNQFNKFPHHTFKWQGIDGTDVITHFPPEDNYNSELLPSALKKAQENFDENYVLDEFLSLFGIGDGGGGATEKIIETGLRCQDLENCPKVKFDSAQNFLDRLGKNSDELQTWVGELYMEGHRGTLTTHGYNKKMNRFMELRMRELEILYSSIDFANYPAKEFDEMWKTILLNQFHDIIPGSSITPVYEDSRKQYEKIKLLSEELLEKVGDLLFQKSDNSLTIINTLSFPYTRPIKLPKDWTSYNITESTGSELKIQYEDIPIIQINIPALSAVTLKKSGRRNSAKLCLPETLVLENDLIRYEFDDNGQIISAFDKEVKRDIFIGKQKGNRIKLFEDRPANWDAWDIDIYYEQGLLQDVEAVSMEKIACGEVRKGMEIDFNIGKSTIQQKIYLNVNSKQLDFETEVDWNEDHKLLRVEFEVDIYSENALFEIQYGMISRNTHRNTSEDMAKFEVAGHRWADLSEDNYGVALLNDCKYGYKIHKNEISLSLLRAPTLPDPKADRGFHKFTYSFLPHENSFSIENVHRAAVELNQKVQIFNNMKNKNFKIPYKIMEPEIILETIKRAEKENTKILRFYNNSNKRIVSKIPIEKNAIEIYEADLMENNLEKINNRDGQIELSFKAFEIKTIKINI